MATALEVRRQQIEAIGTTLQSQKFKTNLAQALPENVSVDRFTRVAITAIQQNPDLLNKDRNSLFMAVTQCAQAGLELDGKQAALVAFGQAVQFMPMIGGLRKIAAKYGITLATGVVHENDEFHYELGAQPTMTHRPPKLGADRGKAIGVWAQALDKDDRLHLEVMDVAEVEKIRAISRAKSSGPWVSQWGEMARKTVARRLWKSLPLYDMDERDARVADPRYDAEFAEDVQGAQETAQATPAATARPSALDRVVASRGAAQEPQTATEVIEGEFVDATAEQAQDGPVSEAEPVKTDSTENFF